MHIGTMVGLVALAFQPAHWGDLLAASRFLKAESLRSTAEGMSLLRSAGFAASQVAYKNPEVSRAAVNAPVSLCLTFGVGQDEHGLLSN